VPALDAILFRKIFTAPEFRKLDEPFAAPAALNI
jgi:hypothetical protein